MPKLHEWPAEMPKSVRDAAENNPPREGAVQVLAWLVRVVKVREIGSNAGLWVERFSAAVGLGKGYAWCISLQYWVNVLVGLPVPKQYRASVWGWRKWANETGRIIAVKDAQRGDILGRMNSETTGHAARFVSRTGSTIKSFEGNTSPGVQGSQREGDGAYERDRPESFWQFAISMRP